MSPSAAPLSSSASLNNCILVQPNYLFDLVDSDVNELSTLTIVISERGFVELSLGRFLEVWQALSKLRDCLVLIFNVAGSLAVCLGQHLCAFGQQSNVPGIIHQWLGANTFWYINNFDYPASHNISILCSWTLQDYWEPCDFNRSELGSTRITLCMSNTSKVLHYLSLHLLGSQKKKTFSKGELMEGESYA